MSERKPKGTPEIPPCVKSLIGCRFGRLLVRYFAGKDKHGSALWCCICDCGTVLRVPGKRLLGTSTSEKGHPQISCGCARADPAVRNTDGSEWRIMISASGYALISVPLGL